MKINLLIEAITQDINLLLEQEDSPNLPDIFKHMVLAIFRKGPRTQGWFETSVMIAFETLLDNGYIYSNSRPDRMRLTSKGFVKNGRHRMEPMAKNNQFDSLWNKFT
jgi:hypothetical protein